MTKQQANHLMDILIKQVIPPLLVAILSWSAMVVSSIKEDVQSIKIQQAVMQEQISMLKGAVKD